MGSTISADDFPGARWLVPDKAGLGRETWDVLHSSADRFRDAAAFREEARAVVAAYACDECHAAASRGACSALLGAPLDAVATRDAAVAWTARFHACVTRRVQAEGGGAVSRASAAYADLVDASPAGDDAALAAAIDGRRAVWYKYTGRAWLSDAGV